MRKTKEEIRKEKWSNRICITKESHQFILDHMKEKKYKTLAGTLDMLIRKYKNDEGYK